MPVKSGMQAQVPVYIKSFGSLKLEGFRYLDILGLKGKTVRNRRGPAAVNGDESHSYPLAGLTCREGMVSRQIRESENQPDSTGVLEQIFVSGDRYFPDKRGLS